MRFKGRNLPDLVDHVARQTGTRFLFDETLRGRITIGLTRPVSKREALELLDAALWVHGFAAIPGPEGFRKILRIKDAATGAPWKPGEPEELQRDLITTLAGLEHASAELVASQLQGLVSSNDLLIAYPPTNSLIMVGPEAHIARILGLARALDQPEEGELMVRHMENRAVDATVDILGEVFEDEAGRMPLRIWGDARTSSIIAHGSASHIEEVRGFLRDLDRPVRSEGEIRVVPVRHQDAEELAKNLIVLAVGNSVRRQRGGQAAEAGRTALAGRQYWVIADPATNSILVQADNDTQDIIADTIAKLDRAPHRVMIEVMILDVSHPTTLALSIDWFAPLTNPREPDDTIVTVLSNPRGGGLQGQSSTEDAFFARVARDPILLTLLDENGNPVQVVLPRETIVITAREGQVDARILQRPRLLVTSGEEHRIFVGSNIPILMGETVAPDAISGTQTRSRVERQDVGVELLLTPTVGVEGEVQLEVHLEQSDVTQSVAGDVGEVGPTLNKRTIETKVSLMDGEVLVMGSSHGLQLTESRSGTPFLINIPFIGRLFEATSKQMRESHTIFAIQARVLRSPQDDMASSIRERLAFERMLSRVRGVEHIPGAPYSILVNTWTDPAAARSVALRMDERGAHTQVGEWSFQGEPRYDLYLTGYREIFEASADAAALRSEGFMPEVVVLGLDSALASSFDFDPFLKSVRRGAASPE